MSEQDRIRRPPLSRTKPIRNWNNVVSVGAQQPDGLLGDDVQNANRVVEEYLRAGEASARLFQRATGLGSSLGDSQDVAQRMTRAAADLMTFWTELFARSTGGASPAAGKNGPPEGAVPSSPSREPRQTMAEAPVVAVEVHSVRPVTVTVDLRPEAKGILLCVDRLHARGPRALTIRGVEIERSDDTRIVTFRVRLPREQEPAVYTGVILDERTSLPAGTITVHVHAARADRGATTGHDRRRRSR